MQVTVSLQSKEDLILPTHHNHILQGWVYACMDQDLAAFLHDHGYMVDGRTFKLFVFSRLMGEFHSDPEEQTIHFGRSYRISIASPIPSFCQSIGAGLIRRDNFALGATRVQVIGAEISQPRAEDERIMVITRSPVCVYSTFLRPTGKKYTCYFQPGEADFNALITNNLRKKYRIAYQQIPPEGAVTVSAASPRLHVVRYKDFIVKGYSGIFTLHGPRPLLQMALDGGLGSKNSQGFGYVELFTGRKQKWDSWMG